MGPWSYFVFPSTSLLPATLLLLFTVIILTLSFPYPLSSVYTDLCVPILKHCPQAIDVPNKQGTTPRQILRRAEDLMVTHFL